MKSHLGMSTSDQDGGARTSGPAWQAPIDYSNTFTAPEDHLAKNEPSGKGKRWFRAQEAAAAANQNQLPCDQGLAQILESIGPEFRSADLGRKFLLET